MNFCLIACWTTSSSVPVAWLQNWPEWLCSEIVIIQNANSLFSFVPPRHVAQSAAIHGSVHCPAFLRRTHAYSLVVSVQEEALTGLQNSLRNSRLARPTHAGEIGEGVRNDWIVSAKRYWEESFDWLVIITPLSHLKSHTLRRRAQEKRINELNHFTTVLPQSDGSSFKFHLIHEPSSNKKAIPLLLLHGWPVRPSLIIQ